MMPAKHAFSRYVAVGPWALIGALMLPATAAAADAPKSPTFTKDIAPIFQEKCEAAIGPTRWRRCR